MTAASDSELYISTPWPSILCIYNPVIRAWQRKFSGCMGFNAQSSLLSSSHKLILTSREKFSKKIKGQTSRFISSTENVPRAKWRRIYISQTGKYLESCGNIIMRAKSVGVGQAQFPWLTIHKHRPIPLPIGKAMIIIAACSYSHFVPLQSVRACIYSLDSISLQTSVVWISPVFPREQCIPTYIGRRAKWF